MKNHPIFCDIDGILTVDHKFYTEINGQLEILSKTFNDKDSYIIEWLKKRKIPIVLISGDERINKNWAKYKGVDFVKAPSYGDKYKTLEKYYREYFKANPVHNYYYLGDNLPDYRCLINSKIGFIPRNASLLLQNLIAVSEIKSIVQLERNGGQGVLEEMITILYKRGYLFRNTDRNTEYEIFI